MKVLIVRLLRRIGLLPFLNFRLRLRFGERYFSVPILGGVGFIHLFQKEKWMMLILRQVMERTPNQTMIDVGVNLGQTLLSVKAIDDDRPYVGFEPNPNCVTYVQELCRANGFKETIWPFAIGANDGAAILYAESPQDAAATLVANFRENYGSVKTLVPVLSSKSLDFLLASRVGVVKIDVEGGELDVVRELSAVIERDRPFIICEVLPIYHVNNKDRLQRQNSLLSLLKKWDYHIFRISSTARLIELETIGIHGNVDDSNYLFLPASEAAHFSTHG